MYSGSTKDKSPKGSVDGPIQELVDYINFGVKDAAYATLSSCSGRIAVFQHNDSNANNNVMDDNSNTNINNSGKGDSGHGLLISHYEINPDQLVNLFFEDNDNNDTDDTDTEYSNCTLKFEPVLLHVAAANLRKGQ